MSTKYNTMHFSYIINNDPELSGNFSFQYPDNRTLSGCSIGSRWDEPYQYFNGDLSSVDIYYVRDVDQHVPECLKELVINNQLISKDH